MNHNRIQEREQPRDLLKHQCDEKVCGAQLPWNTYVYWQNADNAITKLSRDQIYMYDTKSAGVIPRSIQVSDQNTPTENNPDMTETKQNIDAKAPKRRSVFKRLRKRVSRILRGAFIKQKKSAEWVVDDDCKPVALINGAVIYDPELKCELQY
jgi:hypothetical protein